MQIKEIEEKTNISNKTIRFYEEKGLINIHRDESGYRNFTEEDVEELLKIKLLRKCNCSIQEIKQIQDDELKLEDVLKNKMKDFEYDEVKLSVQKQLCQDVLKAKGNYKQLYDEIEELDSDEYKQFVHEMMDISHISLAKLLFESLIWLGPIIADFIFLSMKQYDRLWFSIPISFIAVQYLTLRWSSFLKDYRYTNGSFWKDMLHTFLYFIVVLLMLVIVFGIFILFAYLQTIVFMKDDVYIITSDRKYMIILMLVGVEIALVVYSYFSKFLKHKDYKDYDFLFPFVKKHWKSTVVLNIVVIAFAFLQVNTISKDEIVHYSLLNPTGKLYNYDEIKKVETGFYGQTLAFGHEAGEFYYYFTMDDGLKIKLEDTQTTKKFEEDTYSELEYFDQDVMKYKPEKISSTKNSKFAMLDKEYIDRFKRIINNK